MIYLRVWDFDLLLYERFCLWVLYYLQKGHDQSHELLIAINEKKFINNIVAVVYAWIVICRYHV